MHSRSMALSIAEFAALLEQELPSESASEGDRTGLQIQAGQQAVHSVLLCYEVTEEVIQEARQRDCNLIVAFHPLIFHPLLALTEEDRVGRLCSQLIRYGIALWVVHTRFDAHPEGTSAALAAALGLRVRAPLLPLPQLPGYGMGVIAEAEPPLPAEEFLSRVQERLGAPLRYAPGVQEWIGSVALLGGSGGSFLPAALCCGVDAFVTGDLKYHAFHAADRRLWLIDAGHAETERFVVPALNRLLRRVLPEQIPVHCATQWHSPLRWHPPYPRVGSTDEASSSDADATVLPGAHRHVGPSLG